MGPLVLCLGLFAPAAPRATQPKAAKVPLPLLVYPEGIYNPRRPCVVPVADAAGEYLPVDWPFTYRLAPWMAFNLGGRMDIGLRDDPGRQEKDLCTFTQGHKGLRIAVELAAQSRVVRLSWLRDGNPVLSATTVSPLPAGWSQAQLVWSKAGATLAIAGLPEIAIGPMPAPEGSPLAPDTVTLASGHVRRLNLTGEGGFQLDWTHGYAAAVTPASSCQTTQIRLMGFDSYFVSTLPERRDTPAVELSNGGAVPSAITLRFHLAGELNCEPHDWSQTFAAPPRASTEAAIALPTPLPADIYHLKVDEISPGTDFSAAEHFLIVPRRTEPAGPEKFGLHDSDNDYFGFWPDALPITFAHVYARWSYIVGPPWIHDNHGTPGIDPDTPPDEWAWGERIETLIRQGLTPYVSTDGIPQLDSMRAAGSAAPPGSIAYNWGQVGGTPDDRRYRQFIHQLALRFKGRVHYYEVQNEPNSFPPPGGVDPAVYVGMLKAASEEIHAVDPAAKVYGICGTGDFVPWMTKVLALGGAPYLDGICFHTYVTPRMPDASGLGDKLAQVRALAKQYGKPLEFINSETGTYVALREDVDRPIAPDRLTQLISAGTPTLSLAHGWPNYAQDEDSGSTSIVQDAVYNLAAGAQKFVFFGWNPTWPNLDWAKVTGDGGFALISATRDGVRTPGRYALAVGVLSTQLQPALTSGIVPIRNGAIRGAVFPTRSGGSIAVLWTVSGTATALFRSASGRLDCVSLYGQPLPSPNSPSGSAVLSVAVGSQPIYLHLERGLLNPVASPVQDSQAHPIGDGLYALSYTLTNDSGKPWRGAVTHSGEAGWQVHPAHLPFDLPPGANTTLTVVCTPPPGTLGQHSVRADLTLPDGTAFQAAFPVTLRPGFAVPATTDGAVTDFDALPGTALPIASPAQVCIGRPPALASLQEEKYWKGSAELSGAVKCAWTPREFVVAIRVHDANFRPPAAWPGVGGSCVELFVDARSNSGGGGSSQYGPGAYQIVIRPNPTGTSPNLWYVKWEGKALTGATAIQTLLPNGDYTLTYAVPWSSLGQVPAPGILMGFDIAIDGPPAGSTGRKTQMALFGGANDAVDPSGFALARLQSPGL